MSLSKDQIDQIKAFIHSRGFKHIEVETEILDHVASAVEKKLEENPKKSLEKAIQEVHASFGVFGFASFEEGIIKQTSKQVGNEVLKVLYRYLTSWRIVIVVVLLGAGYFLSQQVQQSDHPTSYHLIMLTVGILACAYSIPQIYPISKKWHKKSLVVSQLTAYCAFTFTVFAQGFGILLNGMETSNPVSVHYFFAFGFTVTILSALVYVDAAKACYHRTYEQYLRFID
ncbi:hypothetical protein [Roseivirga pacifica]|uniref:hypothetical protein n=1 Tax=Roseivirga pacifica TaxID=1267423 RepID=UPI00227B54A6|nr:hypothetical protein [Roseivirga pacifica]